MKSTSKIKLWLLGAAVAVAGFASPSFAVTSQNIEIHVSINATKSLAAGDTFYYFGALDVDSSSTSSSILITNDSGALTETYTLLAGNAISDTGGTDWTLAASTGTDQYSLAAQFSTAQPADNLDTTWSTDLLTNSAVACTATQFGNGTLGESGQDVSPAGGSNTRNLWFRLNTPGIVSDPGGHTATVTIAVQ